MTCLWSEIWALDGLWKFGASFVFGQVSPLCARNWLSLQSDKHQVTLQEKWILRISGSYVGPELKTGSLRQNSSWTRLSKSFPLPCTCINPQALIHTVSWNQWKVPCDCVTCVWTRLDFSPTLTGSKVLFAAITYRMRKEVQKSSGLSSSFLCPVA